MSLNPHETTLLERGDSGPAVLSLKARLRELGLAVDHDQHFDTATEAYVKLVQRTLGVEPTGEVSLALALDLMLPAHTPGAEELMARIVLNEHLDVDDYAEQRDWLQGWLVRGLSGTLPEDPNEIVALLSQDLAELGIREEPGNRGPWVEFFTGIMGENPYDRQPWCGRVRAALEIIAVEIARALDPDLEVWVVADGGAVRNWSKSMAVADRYTKDDILDPDFDLQLLVGAGYVVLRGDDTELNARYAAEDRYAEGWPAHKGTLHEAERLDDGSVMLLGGAGNSSGSGHDPGRGGRYAFEGIHLGAPRSDTSAAAEAGRRFVGAIRLRAIPREPLEAA